MLKSIIAAAALAAFGTSMQPAHAAGEALHLLGRTALPGYQGDFDHLAADVKGERLFVAGEDGGTLEVFDLRGGTHLKTVPGLQAPHAIHYMPATNRLFVTDSGNSMTKLIDGKTYRMIGTVKLTPGADTMGYDPATRHAWVVTGGKNAEPKMAKVVVSEVDPATGRRLGDLQFDTDFTEAIVAEQNGRRLFVNVTGRSEIAVVDKKTRQVMETWPVKDGQQNSAMALDEAGKRLFVVTRKPFKLVVLDTSTGRSVASFDAPQRTNELLFDARNRRLYLTGDDHVAVFRQRDADHYEELAKVPSDKGAKTALLVPELNLLYVAVAGKGSTAAGVLRYAVLPADGP
jgi:DNA-binding beta-propeller fold protein YncE